ncbi:MAG: hypothetical protein K2N94_00390 [Lachnospiraceae bacterium]|nr:hypothetical protein [Lachnospiraceae bacterium]
MSAQRNYKKLQIGMMRLIAVLYAAALTVHGAAPATVRAAEQTADIFYLTEAANMAVTIYYDVEKPEISFVAPNGTVYSEADLTFEAGEGAVCYYIPNAMTGQWRMNYDKGPNGELDVNWAPYVNAIRIEEFTFTPVAEGDQRTEAAFRVTGAVEGRYHYAIYAIVTDADGSISGRKELAQGSGTLNRTETVRVRLSELLTYDRYRLYLEVWRDDHGLEASDAAAADGTFSIVSPDAAGPIEDIYAEIDLTENILTVDWSAFAVRCDEYVIGIFDAADDGEPLYANSFSSDITQTAVSIPAGVRRLRAELTYIRNGRVSRTLKKEIPAAGSAEFTVRASGTISQTQTLIGYTVPGKITAVVAVNGEEQQISLSGTGDFSVNLEDFDNEIRISYSDTDENTVYVMNFSVSVDMIAPILLLPENDVTLFVEADTFELAGATEADCTVTVNGAAAELNADGTFLYSLTLAEGDNEFIVNSRDSAGNVASQLIIIHRLESSETSGSAASLQWEKYLPLILSFLASVLLLVLVFAFSHIYEKNRSISRGFAVAALLRNGSFTVLVPALGAAGYFAWQYFTLDRLVTSEKLFDVAEESVSAAYDALRKHTLYGRAFFAGIIVSAAAAVLFTACLFLARRLKRRADVRKAEEEYICRNCGEKYDEPVKFCSKCGNKMEMPDKP